MKRTNFQASVTKYLLAISLSLLSAASAWSQGRVDLLVNNGTQGPNGGGTIFLLQDALMSEDQVIFQGGLSAANEGALFRVDLSNGVLSEVIRTGTPSPDGNGNFNGFPVFRGDASGNVVFRANLDGTSGGGTDNNGFFHTDGNTITKVLREGDPAPDGNGTVGSFSTDGFAGTNTMGQRVVNVRMDGTAGGTDDNRVLFRIGTTATQIAHEADSANGNGIMGDFVQYHLNDVGSVLFLSPLRNTQNGARDNLALYVGTGGTPTEIWRERTPSPDGNGEIWDVNGTAYNNPGDVIFNAGITDSDNGSNDNTGLVLRNTSGVLSMLAREGTAFVGTNGVLATFRERAVADNLSFAFEATLRNTSGGNNDDQALYLERADGTKFEVARRGDTIIDGNGTYTTFSILKMLAGGQLIFHPTLSDTNGGNADDEAYMMSDGIETIIALRNGWVIDNETLGGIDISVVSFNNHGQISFVGHYGGPRRVQLWTPDLHWRTSGNGDWSDAINWTLSFNPAHVHDVFIDPDPNSVVTLDGSSESVRNLTIGGGAGDAELEFTNSSLVVADTLDLRPNGTLDIESGDTVITSSLTGSGTVTGGDGSLTVSDLLSPGDSPGQMELNTETFLGDNALSLFELGGTSTGEFDQIVNVSELNLDGDIEVVLVGGFELADGMQFVIAEGSSVNGTFDNAGPGDLVAHSNGVSLFIDYNVNGQNVILTAVGDPNTVCAGSGMLVEGIGEVNDFNSTCGSDDTYWAAHGAAFAFLVTDPVSQFELVATAPTGVGEVMLNVDVEASKENDNGNLNIRALLYNFATESYVALPGILPLATTDSTKVFPLPGGAIPDDFIETGTNKVQLLIQTIQTSGQANVRTQLDEVLFRFDQ